MSPLAQPAGRRYALRALQLLVAVALIAWLAVSISWQALIQSLTTAAPQYMLFACALYYVGVAISCWKWRTTLRLEQIELPFARLYRWYLIGTFASNYLPTEIGGDVGRGVLASRACGQPLGVVRSILVERLSGLVAMLALAWLGLIGVFRQPALALGLLAAALGAGGLVLLAGRHLQQKKLSADHSALRWWARLPARLRDGLRNTALATSGYGHQHNLLAQIAALSLAFQLLAGMGVWLNARAVTSQAPLLAMVFGAAMISVVGLLPITVSGWGVREGLIIALLAPYGIPASQALAAALLGRALTMLVTLPGALLLLFERRRSARTPEPQPTSQC